MTAPIPILSSVAELVASADVWICDIWGVLHNGAVAFSGAGAAAARFRAQGGRVLLLSNAPRPADAVALQLDRIGVRRDAYDAIVSSGDLTRHLIASRPGAAIHHLGPERDLPIFAGLDARLTGPDQAELIVCSGLFDDDAETPDDYRERLARFAAARVPMICANPDLTVERGSRLLYCAGALAQLYEQLGGEVEYAGKPHGPAYDLALATIARLSGGPVPRARILAIGDGLRTDILGAHGAGIRSLFIASGVHVGEPLSDEVLARLFDGQAARPVAAMAELVWP